jgi:T-complex protein 1 subunit theta
MVLKTPSKFELRRISRAVKAPCLTRLGAPTPEEIGYADDVKF